MRGTHSPWWAALVLALSGLPAAAQTAPTAPPPAPAPAPAR